MNAPVFSHRSEEIEIMDDLNCSGEVVYQTLRELEFINRSLGGNRITVDGVIKLLRLSSLKEFEIFDLGCGGGDMLLLLSKKLGSLNIATRFTGIDANPNIVTYAKANSRGAANINFETVDILSPDFQSKSFDIAIGTLFFHHFTTDQLVDVFQNLYQQCKLGIVVNDLHRHPIAYFSIRWLTKLFSKSAMVKFDAPLSVLRGFSRKELKRIFSQAGINDYSLTWNWAFRWKVIIYKK